MVWPVVRANPVSPQTAQCDGCFVDRAITGPLDKDIAQLPGAEGARVRMAHAALACAARRATKRAHWMPSVAEHAPTDVAHCQIQHRHEREALQAEARDVQDAPHRRRRRAKPVATARALPRQGLARGRGEAALRWRHGVRLGSEWNAPGTEDASQEANAIQPTNARRWASPVCLGSVRGAESTCTGRTACV